MYPIDLKKKAKRRRAPKSAPAQRTELHEPIEEKAPEGPPPKKRRVVTRVKILRGAIVGVPGYIRCPLIGRVVGGGVGISPAERPQDRPT